MISTICLNNQSKTFDENCLAADISDLRLDEGNIIWADVSDPTSRDFEELAEKKSRTGMTVEYEMPMGPLGSFMDKVKLRKTAERGMENGLYRVKALLEGTGSIPVYITLDAYRHILKEKGKREEVQAADEIGCPMEDLVIAIIPEKKNRKRCRHRHG